MNKKICTRILVALLALVMIIGLLPVASMAEDGASTTETVKGWVKVTDASTLKAGDVLALASPDGKYAAGDLVIKSNNVDYYISQVAADWTQIKEDTLQLTLGGEAGAWTLLNAEGQDLKVNKSTNACMSWNTGDTDYTWTISIDADGLATIVGVDETFARRTLVWNEEGTRFGNYEEANGRKYLPVLYRLEDVPVGGNEGEGEGGGNEGGGNEASNAPTVGTEYYLGVKHGGNGDLEMFFNGLATENAAYRMQIVEATKENSNGAVKVLLEEATGGYNLYFMDGTAKKYIVPLKSGTYNNINIKDEAGTPWTWDAENEILVADLEGTTILMAASGTYINFEAKKLEQLASVYPLKLYTELPTAEAGDDEPVALSDIADVLAGTTGSKYAIKGEITYIDGKSIYLQDSTGAMAIYLAAANSEWKIGDTVEAEGVLDVYNGLPQLKNLTKSELTAGTATIQPIKGGIAVYADANLCKLITLEGEFTVTAVSTSSSSGYVTVTLTDADDNEITLFKPAKTLAEGDKVASITGVLSTYNKLQIRTDEETDIVLATAGGNEGGDNEGGDNEGGDNEGGDNTNPDNGDSSMAFVMVGFASLMAMAAVVVAGKKQLF